MFSVIHFLDALRTRLQQWHPARRRAARKRELERVCKANGCSGTQATGIAAEYFK